MNRNPVTERRGKSVHAKHGPDTPARARRILALILAAAGQQSDALKELLRQLDDEVMFKNLLPKLEAEGDRAYKTVRKMSAMGRKMSTAPGGRRMSNVVKMAMEAQGALARPVTSVASTGRGASALTAVLGGLPVLT